MLELCVSSPQTCTPSSLGEAPFTGTCDTEITKFHIIHAHLPANIYQSCHCHPRVVQEICESTSVNCHRSTIFSQPPPLQTLSNRAAQGNGFGQISTRTELRYQGHRAGGIEEVQHSQQVGMHPQLLAVAGLVEVRLLKNRGTIMIDECPKSSTEPLYFGVSCQD